MGYRSVRGLLNFPAMYRPIPDQIPAGIAMVSQGPSIPVIATGHSRINYYRLSGGGPDKPMVCVRDDLC